jgi:MFS family permease
VVPLAFRNRNFALFWSGLALSATGSQFTTVAMAWQIYQLTDSPLEIGLLGLARAIPTLAMLLFGGLLADAFDRRRLLLTVQVGQLAISVSLVVLSHAGAITPPMLYAASALLALFSAVETPSRQAIVPNLVSREELTSALALNSTQRNVASIAGPSLAGLLLAFSDPAWCYTVDACSWFVMIGALLMLRVPLPPGRGRSAISLASLREGLGFVLTHPVILCFMCLDFGATLFGNPRALFPVFARDILGMGAAGLGLLYAASSVGALLGAAGLSGVRTMSRPGIGVLSGVAFYAFTICIFAVSTSAWLSALMLGLSAAGNTLSTVLRGTVNQLLTPDELRGRVTSVNSLFTNGGPQLGQFESGLVAELWGAEVSALTGGIATLVLVGAVAMVPAVRRFELPTRETERIPPR